MLGRTLARFAVASAEATLSEAPAIVPSPGRNCLPCLGNKLAGPLARPSSSAGFGCLKR